MAAISAAASPTRRWSDPFGGRHNTFNENGFIGGGQIGYNAQYNWLVLGVEGDFDWTNLKGSGTDFDRRLDQYQDRVDLDRYRP